MTHSFARVPELDGLRGLAILLILVGHYFAAIALPEPGSPWVHFIVACRFTWTGVDLFFVLSGYLIGSILLEHRKATNFYRVFYLRRVCRIFPLYYLNVLLFFALLYLGAKQISSWLFGNAMSFLTYLSFTQNFTSVYWVAYLGYPAFGLGVTWSLAIEEQFYLLMPWLVRHLSKHKLLMLTVTVIALALILRFVIYYSFTVGKTANYLLLFTRADSLMLGVLVALIFTTPEWQARLMEKMRFVYASLAVTGLTLLGVNVFRQAWALSESQLMATVGYTWIGVFYACLLVVILAHPQGALTRVFRNGTLQWFGTISYGLYLMHIQVLGLCHGLILHNAPRLSNQRELLVTLLALIMVIGLAKLSWKLFEQPIVNWGRSFPYA